MLFRPRRMYSTNCHCHSTNLVNNPKLVNKGVRGGRGEGIGCVQTHEFRQGCQKVFAVFASLPLSIQIDFSDILFFDIYHEFHMFYPFLLFVGKILNHPVYIYIYIEIAMLRAG